MAVRIGRGSVDVEVEILTCVLRVKIQLSRRHRNARRQKRQPCDVIAEGGKRANLRRMDGLIHLCAIGLKQRSLPRNLDLGGRRANRQSGVDTDADPGINPGPFSYELREPYLLNRDRVGSGNQTGESVGSIVIGHGFLGHGVSKVACFYRRPGNGRAGTISHIALNASGDCRLSVQHADAYQGENCNECQKTV